MGVRGELFSAKVTLRNRTYFFNVKENRLGDLFMTVVESKPSEGEGFDRHQIVLFADDVQEFLKGFDQSLRYIEKEVVTRNKVKREARSRADPRNPEADVPRPARPAPRPDGKKVLRRKDDRGDAKGRAGFVQRSAGPKKPGPKRPKVKTFRKKEAE
jgi:hypothetical protein